MNVFNLICKYQLQNELIKGQFGIEKENFRVQKNGHLAQTPHPQTFAERTKHPFITTDFAESQIELITPICNSTQEAIQFIETLQDIVNQELEDEYLWPYSQPPILPDDEKQILEAQFFDRNATEYRQYLSKKYGKYHQMVSGIHFNFSLPNSFIEQLHTLSGETVEFQTFKNQIYMKIARFYVKHAWLITYLTGMGNIVHDSFMKQRNLSSSDYCQISKDSCYMPNACSFRNGDAGYHNLKYFSVSYDSLEDHIRDLKTSIMQKHIREPREYYTQVRVKPKSQKFSIDELQKEGIHYLEIRSLDLMPTQSSGIKKDFLDFLHLFLVYGLVSDDANDLELDYPLAFQNQLIVANSGLHPNTEIYPGPGVKKKVQTCAQDILASMKQCFEAMGLNKETLKPIEQTKNSFSEINLLIEGVKQQGYTAYFLGLAKKYHDESLERRFQLRHYEDLELSTQVLLKETIKQGIHFYFLDRQDNFLELYNDHLRQWVKQATKTKLDHYASVLAMENKLVTKTLLARAGIHVAYGESYIKPEAAVDVYSHFSDSDIVIKPNQTNFGIGITILKTPYSEKEFAQAIHFAFQFDQRILIEHFFPGKEYRFLVIHDEVVAVLHREAANVIGNGQDSIQELVRQKNLHPMRGEGYRKPLEKIKLEDIEQQFLKKQQLNINSILAKDEKIYLRENSNISTGGDSLDFTDSIPDVYKNIAIKATQSVDAVICGVDMMIRDIYQHSPKGNYCLIELNFNPAIHIHTFPFIGKDRKVAQKILQTLKLIPH